MEKISTPHLRREGELLVVARNQPLPELCWFTGETAQRRVTCLFHWHPRPFGGGTPGLGLVIESLRYYLQDVHKVRIDVPMTLGLYRKWVRGWIFVGISFLFAVATVVALLLVQQWIDSLPKGPERQALNTWLIPAIAFGGFALIALFSCIPYYTMPMPTARFKPTRLTDTHLWLSGLPEEFLRRLDDVPRR